jgi:hypothetical protein
MTIQFYYGEWNTHKYPQHPCQLAWKKQLFSTSILLFTVYTIYPWNRRLKSSIHL